MRAYMCAIFTIYIVTDTLKMYLVNALTVAYLPNFSSPIAFTCVAHHNFFPPSVQYIQA